jgi:hypothetical protein
MMVKIFRNFINTKGKVSFDGNSFTVKIRKHSHTPILLGVEKLQSPITVPWLDERKLNVVFTP